MQYTIDVSLEDKLLSSKYQFTVEVLPFNETETLLINDFIGVQIEDEVSESEELIIEENKEYVEDLILNLTARITSISALGELEI